MRHREETAIFLVAHTVSVIFVVVHANYKLSFSCCLGILMTALVLLLITDKHRGLEQKERELRVGLTLTAQVTHFELCVVNQWIILDRLQELFLNWGKTEKKKSFSNQVS